MPQLTDSITLLDQLDLYRRQAGACVVSPCDPLGVFELEGVLALGVMVSERLRKIIDAGAEEASTAAELADLYRRWCEPGDAMLAAIDQFRAAGQAPSGADAFIDAYREAAIHARQRTRVADAIRQFESRKGKPLPEVMDELRRRTG